MDCPSLAKADVRFSVLSLFWVPILAKTRAQLVVPPRRS